MWPEEAAAEFGRERIAITDHSKTLRITNGMDEARLVAQGEHIAAVNRRGSGPLVLRSIEMDLTPEGAGDMDPAALARLDLVLGAFHSKLRLREDQTDRYFRGLENPDIQVLAHPRGRIYNFRAGLNCDWEQVARRAVETGTAIEIDAYPDRQDLMWNGCASPPPNVRGSRSARMLTPWPSLCFSRSGSRPRSSPASPATALSTSFQRGSSPTESVSFVQQSGATRTKEGRHGR